MKAAYFIAQEKNAERFNSVFDSEDIFVTTFDADQIPSLTAFISRDRAVAQQDYIVIDVGEVRTWSASHILSAVQILRRFSTAQLIFLGEPCEDLTELYGTLASVHRVDNLITDQGRPGLEDELRKCLVGKLPLPDKMQAITQMLEQQTVQVLKPLTIPSGLVLRISVAGTMPRSGVTTQMFGLYHYLKSLGFHPAISDSGSELINLLKEYEIWNIKDDGVIQIKDVYFSTSESPQYNVYLTDCGQLSSDNVQRFCSADVSVLVGCTKPWELPALGKAISMLVGRSCENQVTLLSFSAQEDVDKLSKHLGDHYGVAPYIQSIWQLPEDVSTYTAALLPVLKQICGASHRPVPDLEVG